MTCEPGEQASISIEANAEPFTSATPQNRVDTTSIRLALVPFAEVVDPLTDSYLSRTIADARSFQGSLLNLNEYVKSFDRY